MKRKKIIIILILLLGLPLVIAANDPGHDTLYIEQTGDSELTGELNITSNLKVSGQTDVSGLTLYGDGTIPGTDISFITAAAGGTGALYIGTTANMYLKYKGGDQIVVGAPGGTITDLNVTGLIYEQNVRVCLANGTNCLSGNNSGNVSSIIAGNGISVSSATGDVTISANAVTCTGGEFSTWTGSAWTCGTPGSGTDDQTLQEVTTSGTTTTDAITIDSDGGGTTTIGGNFTVNGTTLHVDALTGYVGIGTTSLANVLTVEKSFSSLLLLNNTGTSGGAAIRLAEGNGGDWKLKITTGRDFKIRDERAGLDTLTILNGTGNVGIGTATPAEKLEVAGNINSTGGDICITGGNCLSSVSGSAGGWTDGGTQVALTTATDNVSAGELFVDNTNNRIGVGTTTPGAQLHINGSAAQSLTVSSTTNANINIIRDNTSYYSRLIFKTDGVNNAAMGLDNDETNNIHIGTATFGTKWLTINTTSSYVGIGDSTPNEKLEVAGNINSTGGDICITGGNCLSTAGTGGWTDQAPNVTLTDATDNVSAGAFFVDNTNNRTGIGTASPDKQLHVYGSDARITADDTDSQGFLEMRRSQTGVDGYILGRINFVGQDDASNVLNYAQIDGGIVDASDGTEDGYIAFRTTKAGANTEQMRITETGNVGIGTTGPDVELAVATSDTSSARIHVQNSDTGYTFTDGFQLATFSSDGYLWNFDNGSIRFGTNNDEHMRLHASSGLSLGNTYVATDPGSNNMIIEGNVGIGTTGPSKPLHVFHATTDNVALFESGDALAGIVFKDSSTTSNPGIRVTTNDIGFVTNNTERIYIDYSGNVGIGTTSPAAPLHVQGGTMRISNPSAGAAFVAFREDGIATALQAGTSISKFLVEDTASFQIMHATQANVLSGTGSGTARMTIDTSGNVGIGTASPVAVLEVVGNASIDDSLEIQWVSGAAQGIESTGNLAIYIDSDNNTADRTFSVMKDGPQTTGGEELFRVQEDGNVGIGTTSPRIELDINATGGENSGLLIGNVGLFPFLSSGANTGNPTFQNRYAENSSTNLRIMPYGDGNANFEFFNNDYYDVGNAWENFRILATDTAFTLDTASGSGGLGRPMILMTKGNSNQIYLDNTTSNVGIGTSNPGTKLDVNGSINVSSTGDVCITGGTCLSSTGSGDGTVTSVTAGNGMTQTGTASINPTLNVVSHAGTAGSIGTINIGADAIGVNLGTTSTTAYRGDQGNTAYTTSQATTNVHGLTFTAEGSGGGLDADTIDATELDNIVYGTYKGTFESMTMDASVVDRTGTYTSSGFTNRPSGTTWTYLDTKRLYSSDNNYNKQINYDTYNNNMWTRTENAGVWSQWYKMWNEYNDGSGSGLDADLLDGSSSTTYLDNTDSQTLSYATATDIITISGGNTIDITEVNTDSQALGTSGNTITLTGSSAITAPYATNADTVDTYHATTASTVNTAAVRDASGDINVRLLRSEYDTTNANIGFIMTQIDTVSNNYVRPSTPAQLVTGLGLEAGGSRDIWVEKGGDTMTGTLTMTGQTVDQAIYYDVQAGNGYGLRFWNSDTYKISMGNAAENKYGPVTDYSIKTSMSNTAGRGWTWGVTGVVPVAAIAATTGNMQIKGQFKAGSGTPSYATGAGDIYATGDLEYDGVLYAPGADIAEKFRTQEELEPGQVVEIDPHNAKNVRASQEAFSKTVVGVVSTDPAMVLGTDYEGTPIALAGQVPVLIEGTVQSGDWLVSNGSGRAKACTIQDILSVPKDERWTALASNERCKNAAFAKAMESGTNKIIAVIV